jgi:UDP-N-acetylglucosamine 2-epimerase (non-hydrolysing)
MSRTLIVVGTRPEIIKMAPVVQSLQARGQSFVLALTGQHYDYDLSVRFIEELELPRPAYTLTVHEKFPAAQTAVMMRKLDQLMRKVRCRLVLIQGDTNSMLATALCAFKQRIPVAHVEAGLRSYDWRMPEEHNRRMVDHASEHLFAPTDDARVHLVEEKVPGQIWVTGNTVIDTVCQYLPLAKKKSNILKQVDFKEYVLATAHRAENVDDPEVLKNIIDAIKASPMPVVFPVHPRTLSRLRHQSLLRLLRESENVKLLTPQGYLDFLLLMKHCRGILTDSGGLQEEATAPPLRKKVLVMRRSTERPEAVKAGFATVVGTEKSKILEGIESLLTDDSHLPKVSPYGNGHAGERIARIVTEELS